MKAAALFWLLGLALTAVSARPGPRPTGLGLFNSIAAGEPRAASAPRTRRLRLRLAPRFASTNGSRIAYGTDARENQFPFVAHVSDYSSDCSGSLIAPRVVLTAAHCVFDSGYISNPEDMAVRLGNVDYTKGKTYDVKRIILPNYDEDTNFADLALLQLGSASPITPIALPSVSTTWEGVINATAMGYGLTEDDESPDILKYVSMVYIPEALCKKAHEDQIDEPLPADHVCFGLDPSRKNTCGGDSGGPYIFETSPPVQVGVVSYGPSGYECGGRRKNLDVPTSMLYWSNWVQDAMSLYNLRDKKAPTRLNKEVRESRCYKGTTLKLVIVDSAGKCCDSCRANPMCKAWTWRNTDKSCLLQKEKGKTTSSKTCTSGYY